MQSEAIDRQFVQFITDHQRRIYAFILSLLHRPSEADDVLQETNTVLWEKRETFEPDSDFAAWACRVAYFQVMAYRKKNRREHVHFDDSLIAQLATDSEERESRFDARREALMTCLDSLTPAQRSMVSKRYAPGGSVSKIAESLHKSTASVSQALYRIRAALMHCIQRKLTAEDQS